MKPRRVHVLAVLLALSLAVAFAPTAQASGEVCQIGSTQYTDFDEALLDADDGDTIKLLANIDYGHGLSFVEKDITFDLNGYLLNVQASSGDGLLANNCVIGVTDTVGGGRFIVTGATRGVQAVLGASVIVSEAHATSASGVGVWAEGGSDVTVQGDATATGDGGLGAYAQDAEITVLGNALGTECGAASYGEGSVVTVGGDAIATGTGGIGAAAGHGGEVTVNGEIQTTDIYIRLDSTDMDFDDVTLPTTKAGYRTYSGGSPLSTVWVKMRVICEIVGGAQYENLVDALSDAGDGDTVRLSTNVSHHSGISIVGKTFTLDLNGNVLNVDESSGTALSVSNGGILLTGSGSFNVSGYDCGVHAYPGGVATVSSVTATSDTAGVGIIAAGGGRVTVTGDVWSDYEGILAIGASTQVTVGGDVTVEANETWGVQASATTGGGAKVDVVGDVTVNGGGGVLAQGEGSVIDVGGDVEATDGGGAKATNGGHVAVEGNVQASAEGASALDTGSKVTVGRNLSGNIGVIAMSGGHVEVAGGVGAVMVGAQAGYDGSRVIIQGGVIVNGSAGVGAEAFGSESGTAEVQIDGPITASTYVRVGGEVKDGSEASRTEPTLRPGYHTYSSDGNIVFVKVPEVEGYPPVVSTEPVTEVTASGANLSGNVTDDGGIEVTERGFVYSLTGAPEIGFEGVTRVTAGEGTGSFSQRLSGLEPDTTYHVRAYASNDAGLSYGEDRTFRTLPLPDADDEPPTASTPPVPAAGETGWLDAPGTRLSGGNVVLYTDPWGNEHIVGLSIVEGSRMKYISRGMGDYEIIYNARPFDDISGHWAKDDIDFSTARLMFIGVAPNLFSPDTAMTRGMLAAVLGRMYGVDPSLYAGHSFDDVPESAYYAPYVKWAKRNGIVFGVSETSFEPERAVTRQEMAAMMHRFMKHLGLLPENGGEAFDDVRSIDSWAQESVMSLRETGILNGRPGNLFDPHVSSTRAEMTAVLRRLIEYIVNQ